MLLTLHMYVCCCSEISIHGVYTHAQTELPVCFGICKSANLQIMSCAESACVQQCQLKTFGAVTLLYHLCAQRQTGKGANLHTNDLLQGQQGGRGGHGGLGKVRHPLAEQHTQRGLAASGRRAQVVSALQQHR